MDIDPINIGVTASQHGLTEIQLALFRTHLAGYTPAEFHHGMCIGGDDQLGRIAFDLGWRVIVHPGDTPSKIALDTPYHVQLPPFTNLTRNDHILDAIDLLFIFPREATYRPRSGTWSTARKAMIRNMNWILINSSGNIFTHDIPDPFSALNIPCGY